MYLQSGGCPVSSPSPSSSSLRQGAARQQERLCFTTNPAHLYAAGTGLLVRSSAAAMRAPSGASRDLLRVGSVRCADDHM